MTTTDKHLSKNTGPEKVTFSDCEDAARRLITDTEEKEKEHNITREGKPELEPEQEEAYREALLALNQNGVKYAVGAAFARNAYTHIWRPTKDLDIFVKAEDLKAAMEALQKAGYQTELLEPHWLAKAWKGSYFIDLIFGTGHNQILVNDDLLAGSIPAELFGVKTQMTPIEELIAAAAFIKERKRLDLPDAMHLILASEGRLDWQRILDRLGDHRQLLLIDLLTFDYIYPGHADYLPKDLIQQLFDEVKQRWQEKTIDPKTFRGSLLDPFSYTVDMEDWGYQDQRNIKPLVDKHGDLV